MMRKKKLIMKWKGRDKDSGLEKIAEMQAQLINNQGFGGQSGSKDYQDSTT